MAHLGVKVAARAMTQGFMLCLSQEERIPHGIKLHLADLESELSRFVDLGDAQVASGVALTAVGGLW